MTKPQRNIIQDISETVEMLYSPMPRAFHAHGSQSGLAKLRVLAVIEAQLEIAKREMVTRARGRDPLAPGAVNVASWEEIGQALGISKQAAWERFGNSTAL